MDIKFVRVNEKDLAFNTISFEEIKKLSPIKISLIGTHKKEDIEIVILDNHSRIYEYKNLNIFKKDVKLIDKFMKRLTKELSLYNDFVKTISPQELINTLLEENSKERSDKLHLSIEHFKYTNVAREWYIKILKKVHPDKVLCLNINSDNASIASAILKNMYHEMIGKR